MNKISLTSNEVFDISDDLTATPPIEDIIVEDHGAYLERVNKLDTPNERLFALLQSTLNPTEAPTHEALWVRKMFLTGLAGGFFFGALLNSPEVHDSYIRKHNASVFDNKYVGNRHFWDTLVVGCSSKGLRYGVRTALLTGSAGLIGFGSTAYRNTLHMPDFILGFAALGALSRLWIGTRGVLAGGVFGSIVGLATYGMFRGFELVQGQSVTQYRRLHHTEWSHRRESILRRQQIMHEDAHMDIVKSAFFGQD